MMTHVRYEVRYVEPDAKWEPADPKKVRRILSELPDPPATISWMAQGNELRTNFADYRIRTIDLSEDARKHQADIDAKFNQVTA